MLVMHVVGGNLETTTQTKAKDNINLKLNNDQVSPKAKAWTIEAILARPSTCQRL